MIYDLEYGCQVAEHQLAGDSKDDDAEELADDIERGLPEVLGEPVRADEYHVQGSNTKGERHAETRHAVLCRDRQQSRERTRTCVHRERERYDRTIPIQIGLEDRDVQNHLQRHEEDDESTGDSEILDLHAEELEYPFAEEKERKQDHKTRQADTPRADLDALLLHGYRHGDITEGVDNGDEENKRGNDLPKIHCPKEILYCFHSIFTN